MNPSPGPWKWVEQEWNPLKSRDGSGVDLNDPSNRTIIVASPEMRGMLLKLEWSGAHDDNGPGCPECGAVINHALVVPNGVHRAGCALAALLNRIR